MHPNNAAYFFAKAEMPEIPFRYIFVIRFTGQFPFPLKKISRHFCILSYNWRQAHLNNSLYVQNEYKNKFEILLNIYQQ